jgi:hypothetical protein
MPAPNGLSTGNSCNRPGRNISAMRTRISVTPAIHTTGRHRGVKGRPVGNSNGKNVTVGIMTGTQVQLPIHPTMAAKRSDPTSCNWRLQ